MSLNARCPELPQMCLLLFAPHDAWVLPVAWDSAHCACPTYGCRGKSIRNKASWWTSSALCPCFTFHKPLCAGPVSVVTLADMVIPHTWWASFAYSMLQHYVGMIFYTCTHGLLLLSSSFVAPYQFYSPLFSYSTNCSSRYKLLEAVLAVCRLCSFHSSKLQQLFQYLLNTSGFASAAPPDKRGLG